MSEKSRNSGFTLVELSIVLVVIGLLIAGVLVGQSLMETVRVDRIVNDLGNYEAAISNFKSSYKRYPGDSPNFTPPGRGNGDIGSGGPSGVGVCSSAYPTLSNLERYNVWPHLSQAGMLKEKYPPYSPDFCGGPDNGDYGVAVMNKTLAPLVTLDSKATKYMGLGNKSYPITAYQVLGGNFGLFFLLGTTETLALEHKMSAQSYVNERQKGLVNNNGVGKCYDNASHIVDCTNADAIAALLTYYIHR